MSETNPKYALIECLVNLQSKFNELDPESCKLVLATPAGVYKGTYKPPQNFIGDKGAIHLSGLFDYMIQAASEIDDADRAVSFGENNVYYVTLKDAERIDIPGKNISFGEICVFADQIVGFSLTTP